MKKKKQPKKSKTIIAGMAGGGEVKKRIQNRRVGSSDSYKGWMEDNPGASYGDFKNDFPRARITRLGYSTLGESKKATGLQGIGGGIGAGKAKRNVRKGQGRKR